MREASPKDVYGKTRSSQFILAFFFLVFIFQMASCAQKTKSENKKYMYTNRLIEEKSPYLLQHAHNPVDWYSWRPEAFAKAEREDKPIFLSIGYSTCHWCHVMEQESFENPEIAKILNDNFISIKVDREDRPDVDSIYMSVVTAMTGSGGWPLNVFLTPDKKPFYGGTYFPPAAKWGAPGLKDVLLSLADAWKNRRKEILESSVAIVEALKGKTLPEKNAALRLSQETLTMAYNEFSRMFDSRHGGFGKSPKFPTAHNLAFLLRYWSRRPDDTSGAGTSTPPPYSRGAPEKDKAHALEMTEKTLTEMARGGIYDHIGGGFHRYSTDEQWHIPHFEKMLYDQAIAARSYLEAYQATGKKEYAHLAREIFDYVLRDMRHPQGGFYSAEDADSVDPMDEGRERKDDASIILHPSSFIKKEGAFYIWREDEINQILGGEDGEIFNYYFGVEPSGNAQYDPHNEFVGKNILYVAHSFEETAKQFGKSPSSVEDSIKRSRQKLFTLRSQRPRPHLDDKILVDWNGLMISSLAFGSRVLEEPRYQEAAVCAAQFILKNLKRPEGRLLHRYREGESAIAGTIADYAFFIHALLDLYEATFDVVYLKEAKGLAEIMLKFFWDDAQGAFFFTASDAEELILRQKEIYDGAIPSGNSIAALDLIRLGHLTLNGQWEKKAEEIFDVFASEISQRPSAYAQMLIALDFMLGPSREIVIADSPAKTTAPQILKRVYQIFLPNKVVVFRPSSGRELEEVTAVIPFVKEQIPLHNQTTVYVCENHVCKLPTNDLKKLEELLKKE